MFSLIKQVFFVSLSFSESLATKSFSLNDEPCMVRSFLIELNSAELKYYPFMINLEKSTGSCNFLSPKICVPKETKDINVKGFHIIRKKSEAKTIQNIFPVIANTYSIVQHIIQIKKWNNKTYQYERKN